MTTPKPFSEVIDDAVERVDKHLAAAGYPKTGMVLLFYYDGRLYPVTASLTTLQTQAVIAGAAAMFVGEPEPVRSWKA